MTVASQVSYRNNRLMLEAEAVISFYLSRRLSKYSARAIIKVKSINSSVNVMYMVTTSLHRIEGRKRNFRSPLLDGKQPPP